MYGPSAQAGVAKPRVRRVVDPRAAHDESQLALLALSREALVTDDTRRLRELAVEATRSSLGASKVELFALDAERRTARLTHASGGRLHEEGAMGFASGAPLEAVFAASRRRRLARVEMDGRVTDVLLVEWEGRAPPGATAFMEAVANIIAIATKRRVVEEALRQRETLSSLGTLVAGVAHEINNPLAFVQGNIDLVRLTIRDVMDGAVTVDDVPEALEHCVSQLDAALKGVDQVASISRGLKRVARAGFHERQKADPNELLETALLIARTRIPAATEIERSLQSSQSVWIDVNGMSQVLLNLLLNAGDALVGRAAPRLELRTRDEGKFCVIEVTDNGPGVPEGLRGSLFTPFFTSKPQGTGLGLSISHRIVREHAGDLTFRPGEREGTTFLVRLPAVGGKTIAA